MNRYLLMFVVAVPALLADQASKFWVLYHLFDLTGPIRAGVRVWAIEVTSFFNWVLVWNYGVSFGLLRHHHEWMPWLLSALAFGIIGGLLWWVRTHTDRTTIMAAGAVCGGAIGNVIDRLTYGAVVDFLDFHAFGYHYPAFNVADSCIVVGVMIILLQSWRQDKKPNIDGADQEPPPPVQA